MKTESQFKNSFKNTKDMYVRNNKFMILNNRIAKKQVP